MVTDLRTWIMRSIGGDIHDMGGEIAESMMVDANTAKDIGVGLVGSLGGNKVADAVGGGNVSHIVGGIAGGIGAGAAADKGEEKMEEKKD
ncbi:hypothetical protein CAJCM15448_04970 [Candidozyma auris]|nr:hypothetical protein CAJCM15448_04970 [[Candida] auris]